MTDPGWLADRFQEHRPRLRAIAYRMLGSIGEAEDTVQDAWLRLDRSDADAIDNIGGWLTTVVARLALDRLRTRRSRPEEPVGDRLPDPIVELAADRATDPEHQVLVADAIGLALLVVLETLTPAERLAFVLHDTFGLPFDEIAPIVQRSPTATRQLASRARRRVRGGSPASPVSRARQRELVDAFIAANRDGDFEALLAILDPEVVVRADVSRGAGMPGEIVERRGAAVVAAEAMRFRSLAPSARPAMVNGLPGAVAYSGGRPFGIAAFSFRAGRISEIYFVLGTERLRALGIADEAEVVPVR